MIHTYINNHQHTYIYILYHICNIYIYVIYIYMYMYMYICVIYICICICIYVWYIYMYMYTYNIYYNISSYLSISTGFPLPKILNLRGSTLSRRWSCSWASTANRWWPIAGARTGDGGYLGMGKSWMKYGKIWEKMRKYGKTGKFWWIKLGFLWFYEFNFLFSSVKRVKIIPCWCCSLGRTQPHIV